MNERELFRLVSSGDRDAFATIFHTYYSSLYSNAFKLLKSAIEAEEMVQDVFTQLWVSRERLAQLDAPVAYLYRMLTNKTLDRMRVRSRETQLQYWVAQQMEIEENNQDAVTPADLHALLEKAVASLPPQRQEVYRLKYHEKLSYQEIADKLQLSRNTVRNHMALALEDIRNYLVKHSDLILLLAVLIYF